MTNYFLIQLNNGESTVYHINYRNEKELIRKVAWITSSIPRLDKPSTVYGKRFGTEYIMYSQYGLFRKLVISKVDGRKIRKERIYTTPASEIDRQFHKEYEKLNLDNLIVEIYDGEKQ